MRHMSAPCCPTEISFRFQAQGNRFRKPAQEGTGRPAAGRLHRPKLARKEQSPCLESSAAPCAATRSEEHTSELQSLAYLVCRLLLEKKKKITHYDSLPQPANDYELRPTRHD